MSFDRPMRLAVFFDYEISAGGAYQQAVNATLLIKQLSPGLCEPVFVSTQRSSISVLNQYGIDVLYLPMRPWCKARLLLRSRIQSERWTRLIRRLFGVNLLDRFLGEHRIDLVYFTSPSELALMMEQHNYVITVWDSCYRDEPEFPEVHDYRVFEDREAFYRKVLVKAVGSLVDSDHGRDNMIRRYGVDAARVHTMPFSPAIGTMLTAEEYEAGYIDIKEKYALRQDYIFYPAQFWAHKNHVYLLYGLSELEKKHGIVLGAILSGGDKGNRAYIASVAESLGLADRVVFAGFVPNEEMPYLYRQSIALVMPTYFGPTNLPPLEAFALEVPVLYPDLPGLRDQVDGAALLMDLSDPSSMADKLHALMTQEGLRDAQVTRGKERLSSLMDVDRASTWECILRQYRQRRVCWGK